jgi:tetratricopeptide (TPR) repeat protein
MAEAMTRDDRPTRVLKLVALALALGFLGWAVYERFVVSAGPGDLAYHAGSRAFEDGEYGRAIREFQAALEQDPEHVPALRGLATSLHKAGRHEEALAVYDELLGLASEAEAAVDLANRGILLDTMGRHEAALSDYETALALDPEVAKGPHWLTRFLRKQVGPPPTIADRARYLRAELAKPEDKRLLRVPEVDQQQRPYKQ